ncbi:antitoxin Xre/MbcA/ParS toxin-binding domain-containing protein [Pseudomonas putida]|uniref:antitoxin Xre/MbcA/ParS toxin-binding domain-containing protein n=1 Tax=Pseudomonas putida TaxID=303 RepID=UPI00062AFFDB|nr:antitoxin Xre/MbcA/ParS toxin-binding domain-containing protein [Pseudomonas putida]KKX57526.1 antitoxin [Pseudomonas putida]
MLAQVLDEEAYRAYRHRLEAFLGIPIDASDIEIHALIEARFPAGRIKMLCEQGVVCTAALSQIISPNTLNSRCARRQRLTLGESDRVFRFAHITAMAETLFGDDQKAQRWLSKPKQRFAMEPPYALLSTSLGTLLVEEFLIQVAEGLAL